MRNFVLDTGAVDFADRTAALASEIISHGIVGNAHTPGWVSLLGNLVPGPFGNIDQRILGRSIAAEIALHSGEAGEVIRENAAMKKLATQFNRVTL